MTYRILSFDGGGIRGVLTARLLQHLLDAVPRLLDDVDLFAGTSTGALIALALAQGRSPADIEKIYRDHGPSIFAPRGPIDPAMPDELIRADYDNDGLRAVLSGLFGQQKLGQLPGQVLVPVFRLDRTPRYPGWAPKVYHNVPTNLLVLDEPDLDAVVADVALETSAAPTYFPAYNGAIDGGVFANNPSMCALAKAVNVGTPVADIRLLSIGTGALPRSQSGSPDWGFAQWGPKMLSILMSGVGGVAHYQCQQLLGGRYRRADPELPHDIDLDRAEAVDELTAIADAFATTMGPLSHWVETVFLK